MKVEWGFDRFMSQEAFNNPENGYVVDDTCVLGAEVYVCQEKFRGREDCLSMVKDPISYKHTWKIGMFSALTADCEDSKTFMAAEHKWYNHSLPFFKQCNLISVIYIMNIRMYV